MYCPKCGKYLADTARFCATCGYQVSGYQASAKENAQQKQRQPFFENAPTTFSGGGVTIAVEPQRKNKNSKTIGIVVAAALVALAIAAVAFVLVNQKSPVANVRVGDVIHLGEVSFTAWYGGEFKQDIAWRVLAIENGRVLLIAEDIIELRPYNEERTDTTWEQSTIRQWLNGDFYNGLPKTMQRHAVDSPLTNADNSHYGISAGNDTADKVFLLSIDEAERYFSSGEARRTGINLDPETVRQIDNNNTYGSDIKRLAQENGGFWWWLRSPGYHADHAAYVDYSGTVHDNGDFVDSYYGDGVRPAIWLSM